MLLENELDKIASIENNSNVNNDDLKKLISKNESSIEKIFFLILKDNFQLVDSYNRNITTITELNRLYFTVKQYCLYIIGSDNEKDFEKNIPKYLFREKSIFLNIFNKIDYKKKLKLLDLLFKTEKLIRINGDQSVSLGLRFLLNLKKITISKPFHYII